MSTKRMSYNDIYELIAMYANDVLPFYADKWSRFPCGNNAIKIIKRLENTVVFYRKINSELSSQIDNAIIELNLHIDG